MKTSRMSIVASSLCAVLVIMPSNLSARPPQGGGGGGGKQPATTFSGRAVVVDASVLGIRTIISDTGPLPSGGGALETSLLTANVPGLLSAEVLHAATVGQGTTANAEASVANLNLTVAGASVSAGLLMSRARAECNGNTPTVSGSSEVVNLNVNGIPIVASGAPNQTVQLLNVTVIINEQAGSVSGNTGTITVNALHVIVTDPLHPGNVLAEVVISSAHADIGCNRTICGGGDFVTGGGWIIGTPSGARGNFGVAGGLKKRGLWGHLVFIDHGSGMKVHGTGVTSYTVVNATTRRITGTAEINGQAGFAYTVEVSDNGEPGRNDTFSLSLSNGYYASGRLEGGNIQLHLPHPCP